MTYRLYVEYQGFSIEKDKQIEAAAGKARSGSGAGMGGRDMDFDFRSRKKAKAAEKAVSAIPGVTCRLVEDDDA